MNLMTKAWQETVKTFYFFPAQLRSNNSSSTKRRRPLSPGVNTTSAAQPLRHYGTLPLVVWAPLGKGFG